MKRVKQLLALALAMPLLGACVGGVDFDELASLEQSGDPYYTALHREYSNLSKGEYSEQDWRDAVFFADRARMAAGGEYQGPQAVEERDIAEDALLEINLARAMLVTALNDRRDVRPSAAARAQAMFDCWLQEKEEDFQPAYIEACKKDFQIAYDALVYEKPMMAAAAPEPSMAKQAGPFMVFFGFDSDALDKAALSLIENLAQHEIAQDSNAVIMVSGHADRSGNKAYNRALSEQRAISVEIALQLAGAAGKVVSSHFGEEKPLQATDDGVREPKNRRVEILLAR